MTSKFYSCYKGTTTDEDLKKAENERLDIRGQILSEMLSDGDNDTGRLVSAYLSANEDERASMDYVITCLCGWTLHSIIDLASKNENYLEE